MRSRAVTALVVLLGAPAAFAQERGVVPQNERQAAENEAINLKRAAEVAARIPLEAPVKGAPYSADVIVGTSQTLADGNHISHSETSHVYRDSEGRIRREQNGTMSTVGPKEPIISTRGTVISIVDPVAGYSYSLDAEHKIAWRTPIGAGSEVLANYKAASNEAIQKLKAEKEAQAAAGRSSGGEPVGGGGGDLVSVKKIARGVVYNDPKVPLEHATIDGLAVEGRKRSETIPAGKIGNELPLTITSEEWTSTDLKVLVLTKHSDPRTGESTYRLSNVVRAEPDPSLFMVPPDYTVKDTGIRRNNE